MKTSAFKTGAAFAFAVLISVGADQASSAPFSVTNGDFVGNSYTFSYFTRLNQSFNGANAPVIGDPWLTNSGWVRSGVASTNYWQLPPAGLGRLYGGSGVSGTVGWDFSGITGAIAKVELLSANILFQIPQGPGGIGDRAIGDKVTGDVATPASFGTGAYTNMYTLTGDGGILPNQNVLGNGGGSDPNTRTLMDITSLLSPVWLNNPNLLELRFGFQQNPSGLDIFSDSAQVFRSLDTGGVDDELGMRLVVTMSNTAVVPLPAALPLFMGGLGLLGFLNLRRKRRTA